MKTIETIGYILKKGQLASLTEGILSNTFVIETLHPYPGYHGKDLPGETAVSEFIFLITKSNYSSEEIFRATKKINKYLNKTIDAAKATVNIYNQKYPSIRIKGCHNINELKEIQLNFKSEGIKFAKAKKIELPGLVKIQKQFYIEEIEKGIYKDLSGQNYTYIELPMQLSWEQFRSIVHKIRNSTKDIMFDAALGVFYRIKGITDVVRIYNKETDYKAISMIKDKFYDEIKKLYF